MCYSAMVRQDLKQLSLRFLARVDVSLFVDLFVRKGAGEKIQVSRALERNFVEDLEELAASESVRFCDAGPSGDSVDTSLRKIGKIITEYSALALHADQQDLFAQRRRKADAERKLASKPTKTAERDKGIAERKIEALLARIERRQSSVYQDSDARIFPMYYTALIVSDGRERVIRPYRYHLRPNGQAESFDAKYSGCYNARYDNLESPFWRSLYGKQHGILVVGRFYENVARHTYEKRGLTPGESEQNVVVEFAPRGADHILVPCLYDDWTRPGVPVVRGCAALTFEPPAEVAATGHDRCPGFLKAANVDAWLFPQGRTKQELSRILEDREQVVYEHALVA